MTRPIHPLVLAALFLPLAVWLIDRDRDTLASVTQAKQDAVHADSLRKVAEHKADSLRVQYAGQRQTLTKWRTQYDSVRVTDTLVVDSVVYVPRDIADSTILSCVAVVQSCEARVQAEVELRDAWKGRYDASEQLRHAERVTWQTQVKRGAVLVGAGIVVGLWLAK